MILDAEQLAATLANLTAHGPARDYRNHLLALSDSHVWPDHVPDQWRTYRQALRDLPAQEFFPETVNWPVAPS
jgi:nitrogen fixation protein